MRYNEISQLQEGKHDKFIFKAVFMAGGPGSGKSTIAKQIFSGTGLKLVDRDNILLQFTKMHKSVDRSHIGVLRDKTRNLYIDGRLGMIIDGTARKAESITELKMELESLGYDTMMIFVSTDLEEAKRRVLAREQRTGRKVPEEVVISSWHESQQNLAAMQSLFSNFHQVDNTVPADLSSVNNQVYSWLNTPTNTQAALDWLESND